MAPKKDFNTLTFSETKNALADQEKRIESQEQQMSLVVEGLKMLASGQGLVTSSFHDVVEMLDQGRKKPGNR